MNQRKTIVINPSFQYRFILIITSLVFITSLIYPFALNSFFEQLIARNIADPVQLNEIKKPFFGYLIIMQLLFVSVIAFIAALISHKIAGPLYKLSKTMKLSKSLNFEKISFRKGDYFQELCDDFNDFREAAQKNNLEKLHYLSEVVAYMKNIAIALPADKKPVINEIINKLNEINSHNEQE